jgi:hypothetical protein
MNELGIKAPHIPPVAERTPVENTLVCKAYGEEERAAVELLASALEASEHVFHLLIRKFNSHIIFPTEMSTRATAPSADNLLGTEPSNPALNGLFTKGLQART